MLIWRGWGILLIPVMLLGLGTAALARHLLQSAGMELTSESEGITAGIGFLIAGGYAWLFQRHGMRHLDKPEVVNIPLDKAQLLADGQLQTHVQAVVRRQSSLFFIPVSYWWMIFTAIGIVVFVLNVVHFLSS